MVSGTLKLINFITNLDEEKQDKLIAHLDLLKRLASMSSKELYWTQYLIKEEFGGDEAW